MKDPEANDADIIKGEPKVKRPEVKEIDMLEDRRHSGSSDTMNFPDSPTSMTKPKQLKPILSKGARADIRKSFQLNPGKNLVTKFLNVY